MKVFYLFLLFCVLTVHAQRRASTKQDAESTTPKTPRGRGKTRFTLTPELSDAGTEKSASSNRRSPSRTRTNTAQTAKPKSTPTPLRSRSYEVEEVINESPIDSFRRSSKPRVLTETAFVAANAGERTSLFQPATPAAEQVPVEDILQTFGSTARSIAAQNAAISGRTHPSRAEAIHSRSSFIGSRNDVASTRDILQSFGNTARAIAAQNAASSGTPRPPIRAEVPNSSASPRNEIVRNSNSAKTETRRGRTRGEASASRGSSRNENGNGRSSSSRSEAPRTVVGARTIPVTRIESRTSTPSTRPETSSSIPSTRAEIVTPSLEAAPSSEEFDDSAEIDETTLKASSYEVSSETTNIENDIRKEPVRVNTALDTPQQPASIPRRAVVKRINTRTRNNEEESSNVRGRSRSRGSRRQNEDSLATSQTRTVPRTSKRRTDEVRGKGPSVFNNGESLEARSRTERRIGNSAPEKITIDLAASTTRDRGIRTRAPSTTTVKNESRNRAASRFSSSETTTARYRARSRNVPPTIDEQKLEVLPLFASEAKTVRPTKKLRSRGRNFNSAEDVVQISATENDVRFLPKPSETTTRISISRTESVESTTKPTRTRKPVIKESVVAEVNEVTSKRTVGRRRNEIEGGPITRIKVDKPKVTVSQVVTSTRSRKKTGKVVENKKRSSEEEIDEGDNYPEAFKALLNAKKQKKESRPAQPRLPSTKTTERGTTTSTAATTTTTTARAAASQDDNENELVPKPSPTTPISVSRSRKRTSSPTSRTEKPKTTTAKRLSSRLSSETVTKASRKSNRLTTTTPATTTSTAPAKTVGLLPTTHRFHAKFTTKNDASVTPKPTKTFSPRPSTRGVYSSKKKETDSGDKKPKPSKKQTDESSRQISKSSIKSRYSSRYRNDISQRVGASRSTTSAPFYTPTVPTVVYSSTTPSKSSRRTTVNGGKDKDLGLEVISFDDPVNSIPSANLVNGELLTTDKVLKVSALVKERSTEKPLSIIESIERIINSVTAISSTAVPNVTTPTTTTTTTTEAPTKSSAILKLATKKSTKDKTNTDKTQTANPLSITSEKPTTIIEKILSSLNAIQNDESNQVGRDFNTVSSPSTTPIAPQVTKKYSSKYSSSKLSLAAPSSTSINPLSIFNEISEEQIKEKRTIGKLLTILNGLTSTSPPEELVVVTPKNFVTNQYTQPLPFSTAAAQTFSLPLTLSTTPSSTTLFTPASQDTSSEKVPASLLFAPTNAPAISTSTGGPLFTSAISEALSTPAPSSTTASSSTLSTLQTQTPTAFTTVPVPSTTQSSEARSTTQSSTNTVTQEQQTISTETGPTEATSQATSTRAASSNEVDANPLSVSSSTLPESTTQTVTPSDRVTTESTVTAFTLFPTTIPTITNFEVSPGSVSVYSANDVSNFITPEDNLYNTVTISGRANFDTAATTDSTTTEISSSTESSSTVTASTENSTIPPDLAGSTSTMETSRITTDSGTEAATPTMVSPTVVTNTTTANKINATQLSNRSGRLLNVVQEPVSNNIDSVTPSTTTSTTPDYFIFAILNNNTILRKRPPTVPNRQTPFLIVGVYPNNTVVKKYPNGTLVPMEQIIRVRGFDTRENPPPLPEITSNQVTEGGPQNSQTVEQNRTPPVNPLSVDSSTTASPTTSSSTNPPSSTFNTPSSTTTPVPSTTTSSTTAKPLITTAAPTTSTTVTPITSTTTTGTTTTAAAPTTRITTVSTTTATPTTSATAADTATAAPVTSSTSNTALPTLSEILNGKTVEAFNNLINTSSQTSTSTTTVAPATRSSTNYQTLTTNQVSTTPGSTTTLGLTSTLAPFTSAIETTTPVIVTSTIFTTPPRAVTTIAAPTSVSINNRVVDTTTMRMTSPRTRYTTTPTTTFKSTQEPRLTTVIPTLFPSTNLPSFLSTLFPNIFTVTPTPQTTSQRPVVSVKPRINTNERDNLILSATTAQPATAVPTTTTLATTTATTRQTTTTQRPTTTTARATTTTSTTQAPTTTTVRPTTTVLPPTTTRPIITTTTTQTTTKRLKELTAEQRKNLEAIAQLEKQQADLLKQLSFLTNLNFAGINNKVNKPNVETTTYNSLANRVIAIAMEREKSRSTTKAPPKSIQDQIAAIEATVAPKKNQPSLEELLKQYNVTGVDATPSTTYGKSQDAILASILKEQGIGPSTPKALEGIFEETTTTKKPKPRSRATQTPPGGRLRQGLNWLLNVLAPPPTTRRPTPKPKTKKPPADQEVLTNQPTKITPVVTAAPKPANKILSQDEIKGLIKQLEAAQRDPKKADELDLSKIKSLQHLIQGNEAVEITSAGQNGASSRSPPTKRSSTIKPTTALPSTVSNSIDEDEEEVEYIKPSTSTIKARPSLPPLKLRPVAGVDDNNEPFIRGNLITAAVNVTRAISGFLGTALQGAASTFRSFLTAGSSMAGNVSRGSSIKQGPG